MLNGIIRKRPLTIFLLLSFLAHCALFLAAGGTGVFDLSAPVGEGALAVDFAEEDVVLEADRPADISSAHQTNAGTKKRARGAGAHSADSETAPVEGGQEPEEDHSQASPAASPAAEEPADRTATRAPPSEESGSPLSEAPVKAADVEKQIAVNPPLRHSREFLTVRRERLTYRISTFGIAVGEAIVEATNERGRLRVTMSVVSSPLVSKIYPVEDEVSTELVAGNYIISKIRQREGDFRHHEGVTLMLREKKVFSADLLREVYRTESLPREDVTDIVLGFYFLRNQPLEVGDSVLLQLYDAGIFAPTLVDVLRKERIETDGLGEVDTLVICPRLKTRGIFRRTGDIEIWLTADSRRVPVRVRTTIPLGVVTADLISSEVEREPEEAAGKDPSQ